VVIGHVPPLKAEPGKPLTLRATYATPSDDPHVYAFYRNSQALGFTKLDLQPDGTDRTWSATIPAEQVLPGSFEYYFGANSGRWSDYDETIAHRPPFHVRVTDVNSKPVISPTSPSVDKEGRNVTLETEVKAASPIQSVFAYYKLMPSSYEWLKVAMHPAANGSFTAKVPVTPEGILYYFEAIDESGNAANYPNFMEQTPYFVIDSWAPESASH
jgi:hypothetical protein